MEKWSIVDVENWLVSTKQITKFTEGRHPVLSLNGAELLETVKDASVLEELFRGYPPPPQGPSMTILKMRVGWDKDKGAEQGHIGVPAHCMGSVDITSASANSSGTRPPTEVVVATHRVEGRESDGTESDEQQEGEEEQEQSTNRQVAMTVQVAMHNAVYDTNESLTTEPNGNSVCNECSQSLAWCTKEGARTATKHFASKRHNMARQCAQKPAIEERRHTAGDMHRVLGLPVCRGYSRKNLTPQTDMDGNLVGLACACGKQLKANTVFMAIGNLRKHKCVGPRQRGVPTASKFTPRQSSSKRSRPGKTEVDGSSEDSNTASVTPTRRRQTQTRLTFTPTSSSSTSCSSPRSDPVSSSSSSSVWGVSSPCGVSSSSSSSSTSSSSSSSSSSSHSSSRLPVSSRSSSSSSSAPSMGASVVRGTS